MQMIDIEQLPGGIAPPPVRVGDASIDEETIALEMQYHPAETAGEAQLQRRLMTPRAATTRTSLAKNCLKNLILYPSGLPNLRKTTPRALQKSWMVIWAG